jgi:hypothetical protein
MNVEDRERLLTCITPVQAWIIAAKEMLIINSALND